MQKKIEKIRKNEQKRKINRDIQLLLKEIDSKQTTLRCASLWFVRRQLNNKCRMHICTQIEKKRGKL
jgi:hypothetical protein